MKKALFAFAVASIVSPLLPQGFGAPQILSSVVANYGDPITADLDGDGDQDVIVFRIFTPTSGPTDWRIVWLANDGAGNFGAPQTVTTAVLPDNDVHAADLDGDGDIDLISAQTQQGKLAYYLNDGAGNFGPQQIIPGPAVTAPQTGWSPYSIDTADFDGDGDLDVLSASNDDDKVAWYANSPIATVNSYGYGCGAPSMVFTPTSTAIPGQPVSGTITNTQNGLCVVAFGSSNTSMPGLGPLPLDLSAAGMPGCTLYQSADVFGLPTAPTGAFGEASFSLTVPATLQLVHLHAYFQAFSLVPSANSLGVIASNGVDFLIGNQ